MKSFSIIRKGFDFVLPLAACSFFGVLIAQEPRPNKIKMQRPPPELQIKGPEIKINQSGVEMRHRLILPGKVNEAPAPKVEGLKLALMLKIVF